MRLRTFTARTMTEAMGLVRAQLGPEAIIVSTEEDDNGEMCVTAALDLGEAWPTRDLAEAESAALDDVIDTLNVALTAHGLSPALIEKILAAALPFDQEEPATALAGALAALYGFAPIVGAQRPLLFVGPPGAGKTVSIAKLATRAVIAGSAVRLVTADTVRAGGIQQLQAFADILRVRLDTVENAPRLAPIAARAAADELMLIDSPGINPYNAADRRELAALVAAGEAEPVLVLPAGGDAVDTAETAEVFRDLGCTRMIVTRFDMVRRLGSVVSAADALGLDFCEAGVSSTIADGLTPLDPVVLARLLMPQPAPPGRHSSARRGSP